jgi:hypothetical protein
MGGLFAKEPPHDEKEAPLVVKEPLLVAKEAPLDAKDLLDRKQNR